MLDQDYENNIISKFEKRIPGIFINNIRETYNKNEADLKKLKGIYFFYRELLYYLPPFYLSKSRIRVGDDPISTMFCKNPYEDGTTENLILHLEEQFFSALYLLLGGHYRPIHTILRYMLQYSNWVAASIIDKEKLTKDTNDNRKAMSVYEFASFLRNNRNALKLKNKSIKSKQEKTKKTITGIVDLPSRYVEFINIGNFNRMNAIRLLYSKLSEHAHASTWVTLRSDGADNDTSVGKTGLYTSIPDTNKHELSLFLLIKTHEIIFYMLFVTCYENLIYFHKEDAKSFSNSIKHSLKKLKRFGLEFPSLEKCIESPLPRRKNAIDWDEITNPILDPDSAEDVEDASMVCALCRNYLSFEYELCCYCHMRKIL